MSLTLFLTKIVASGTLFTCTPIAVWDGDGPIWCREGPKIRLAGIAAREIDETCKPQQPCPPRGGKAARDYLVHLLGGPRGLMPTGHVRVAGPALRCLSQGHGKGSRTAAWCGTNRGVDLSCALVRSGYALRWKRYRGDAVCRNPA